MNHPASEITAEFLLSQNYLSPRFVNGKWACIYRFAHTHAIISDIDDHGYNSRWCYHNYTDAIDALDKWDHTGEPDGWFRALAAGQPIRKKDANGKIYNTY